MVPMLVVAFCMNDYKYGGAFSWSIGPNDVYAGLTIPCVVGTYTAVALVVEEKAERVGLGQYIQDVWGLLKQRVVWQICAFKFLNGIFFGYNSTLSDPISSIWFFRVVAMFIIGKYALDWDWRITMAVSTVGLIVFDATVKGVAICSDWDK
ncbi:hypothetical protein AeNC1_017722, partial [Aphanomyces euteiches]